MLLVMFKFFFHKFKTFKRWYIEKGNNQKFYKSAFWKTTVSGFSYGNNCSVSSCWYSIGLIFLIIPKPSYMKCKIPKLLLKKNIEVIEWEWNYFTMLPV